MGPTWVLSAPDGPQVGPMNLAIRGVVYGKISPRNYADVVHLWLGHAQPVVAAIVHVTHILSAARPMYVVCPCSLMIPTVSLTQKSLRHHTTFTDLTVHSICKWSTVMQMGSRRLSQVHSHMITAEPSKYRGLPILPFFCFCFSKKVQCNGFTVESTSDNFAYHVE